MFAPFPPALTREAKLDRLLEADMRAEVALERVPAAINKVANGAATFAVLFLGPILLIGVAVIKTVWPI